jgi:hypothetical protein
MTPEKGLNVLNCQKISEPKKSNETVEIHIDGTACEGQVVPAGMRCYWIGFDKTTGKFFGRPKDNSGA